jgi:hypothetical protein
MHFAGRRGVDPPCKLLDHVRDAILARHYSRRTEEAYVHWIRLFPRLGIADVMAKKTVAADTDNDFSCRPQRDSPGTRAGAGKRDRSRTNSSGVNAWRSSAQHALHQTAAGEIMPSRW